MRISDWSSDVCSSDLMVATTRHRPFGIGQLIVWKWAAHGVNMDAGREGGKPSSRVDRHSRRRQVGAEPGVDRTTTSIVAMSVAGHIRGKLEAKIGRAHV